MAKSIDERTQNAEFVSEVARNELFGLTAFAAIHSISKIKERTLKNLKRAYNQHSIGDNAEYYSTMALSPWHRREALNLVNPVYSFLGQALIQPPCRRQFFPLILHSFHLPRVRRLCTGVTLIARFGVIDCYAGQDCFPENYQAASDFFYSPGVYPFGYETACSSEVAVDGAAETRATCCPR